MGKAASANHSYENFIKPVEDFKIATNLVDHEYASMRLGCVTKKRMNERKKRN